MSGMKHLFCPICKNEFDINGLMAKCPECGYTSSVKALEEKEKHIKSADDEIAAYRLLSSADAFFSRKSYEEAYIGYSAVLDADGSCLKAFFRRELTSQYLMAESSSAYLSCGGFFSNVKEVKKRLTEMGDEKLSLTICRDMLDFISSRADYEKKYASVHKNEKTAAAYMSDTLQLFEYTAETVRYLSEKTDIKNKKERAFLIMDGCALCMKVRGMLLSGAEYVETKDPDGDKGVSMIKRRKLSHEDEMQVGTLAGNIQKIKKDLMSSVPADIYEEIKETGNKTEKKEVADAEDDEKKREEYETWQRRNEREYLTADKRIIIFDILGKGALVMAAVMAVVFAVELMAFDNVMIQLAVIAALFAAADVVLGILKRSEEKKKGFYSRVIANGSTNMRVYGNNFKE